MTSISKRIFWWALVLVYITAIYSTVFLQAEVWRSLDHYGVMMIGWCIKILVYALLAFVLFRLLTHKKVAVLRSILFVAFLAIFYFITHYVADTPRERFHIIEYAVLAILLYNALSQHMGRFSIALYVWGILLCIVVGVVDEVLQGATPNRSAELRDLVTNISAIVTVFLAIRFHVLRKTFWDEYFGDIGL